MDGTIRDEPQEHDQRKKVRAAGSMDTTISDLSKFAAALVKRRWTKRRLSRRDDQAAIAYHYRPPVSRVRARTSRSKSSERSRTAGLGVIVFDGPQGHGFYKGGHDGQTANTMVCIEASRRCVVYPLEQCRAEAGFARPGHALYRRYRCAL